MQRGSLMCLLRAIDPEARIADYSFFVIFIKPAQRRHEASVVEMGAFDASGEQHRGKH